MICSFLLLTVNMSRPNMSPSPATAMHSGVTKHGKAKGFKDIRIDEEVKIAVNFALERFRYSDQEGKLEKPFTALVCLSDRF